MNNSSLDFAKFNIYITQSYKTEQTHQNKNKKITNFRQSREEKGDEGLVGFAEFNTCITTQPWKTEQTHYTK